MNHIDPPQGTGTPSEVELAAWLLMRWSGALLLILILVPLFVHLVPLFVHLVPLFVHLVPLFVHLVLGDGIQGIDLAFVAGRWAHRYWQWFDLILLWSAMLHGTNGPRVIIDDYTENAMARLWLKSILMTCSPPIVMLRSLVIFTFDPCPAGARLELLPQFCEKRGPQSSPSRPLLASDGAEP